MLDDATLTSILRGGHYVTDEDLHEAERFAQTYRKGVIEYLYSNHLLTPDLLGQAIAEWYHVPYADLNSNPPSDDFLLRIPPEIAQKYRVLFLSESETDAVVTTDDPSQKILTKSLAPLFPNRKISIAYSLSDDIDKNLL
ncbi:MAG: hypothetical protein AAB855_01580, partial [Patescibacteria group bacterium]